MRMVQTRRPGINEPRETKVTTCFANTVTSQRRPSEIRLGDEAPEPSMPEMKEGNIPKELGRGRVWVVVWKRIRRPLVLSLGSSMRNKDMFVKSEKIGM